MLIQRLRVSGLLSFGPDGIDLPLEPLNVFIGLNGSGKSNILDVLSLLRNTPRDLDAAIRKGGGIHDWIWRGQPPARASSIEVVVAYANGVQPLRYVLGVRENGQRFEVAKERIENKDRDKQHHPKPYFYYEYRNGRATLNHKDEGVRKLRLETVDPQQSVLSQRKEPDQNPELFWLGQEFNRFRLYREWSFGRGADARMPQKPALPNDFLSEDARNLGLILNRLKRERKIKTRFLKALGALYEDITDFDVIIEGGTVQVVIEEGDLTVPANRLSDGTLRYVSLLAVLLHPEPPPLLCVEEPELGLHLDLLPTIRDLLVDASKRTQVLVTTHSDILVDALSEQPESVVICAKSEGRTTLRRLNRDGLAEWLKEYTLGALWTDGKLGGTRW